MTRETLIQSLENYQGDPEEEKLRAPIIHLLQSEPRCFYRDCFSPGHITGSGLLISRSGEKVLLNHHKIMNIWVGFGGHADGEENIAAVATREVIEESGIAHIQLIGPGIFDIDIHPVPANPKKNEPAHNHFDISFLFQTVSDENFVLSDESLGLAWCNLEEAKVLVPTGKDLHMDRMLRKWKNLYR